MPYPTPTGPAGHAAMGAVDEQALKRLRYERALDAACGIPPEESQHPGAYAMDPAQAGACI